MNYWLGYITIFFLVGGVLLTLVVVCHKAKRTTFSNLFLVLLALFAVFMALEFYFKVFFAETDDVATLAKQNWQERYIRPEHMNSLGYRDIEWTDELIGDRTKVMVVGDSFVFGDGIEYTADRFPDQLNTLLGEDYVVFNLGKGGTNTNHHIQYVLDYPFHPDILILSYVVNDIKGALLEEQWQNRPRSQPYNLPDVPLLTRNSYAANFLYWRLARLTQRNQPGNFWRWYLSAYNNPDSWWKHKEQLLSFYEGSQSEQIPFMVVVFPDMNQPEETLVVTDRIVALFEEQGVPVLDVYPLIRDMPLVDRKASAMDGHPGELVHKVVAESLYDMFKAQGLVEQTAHR